MNSNQIVYRTIVMKGTSEGLDKVAADLNKVAAAHKGVTVASEQTEKTTLSLEQAMKRQSLRLDEVARAQNNIARERQIADKGLKEGLIDQTRHNELMVLASQRYGTTSKATAEFGKQTGLARHELINLGRQAQDVGVSLASGQSPFTVLVQQGSQIADVFATSGGTLRGFFSQAIGWAKGFLTSTGGIVTAVLAIGGAAIYAASQFVRASTTIEEALENQNRLLKEGKALIDQRTSAEARAALLSKEQTQFETGQNLKDLQAKLKNAQEEAARRAASISTRPTGGGMPEMGEAPTGFAALSVPGMDKITDAFQRLNAAREAGLPGLKQFNAEISKVGMAHPELALIVEDLIKAGRAGMDLEFATLRAKAMADALAGVATNAQMAAVGLGSIAQFNLNNLQATQAAEATERMAKATLEMAALYPGMSIEVAKQLDALLGQLQIAQARTGREQMIAQEIVTQNNLLLQGKTLEEAVAIAAAQRAVAEANVAKSIGDQIHALEDQIKLSNTRSRSAENAVQAEIAYNNAVRDGATASDARALKDATLRAAQAQDRKQASQQQATITDEAENYGRAIQQSTGNLQSHRIALEGVAYEWSQISEYMQSYKFSLSGTVGPADTTSYTTRTGPEVEREFLTSWRTLDAEQRAKPYTGGLKNVPGELTEEINKKLDETFKNNTEATKENTAATQTMTDVLSPFYSSDPRRTHLGFRSFAGGGIMTPYGELPLKQYQSGGVASSPQVAVYGEGATPEAYVPVPSGRIPVEIKQPANNNQRPVNVTINVMGNADANTVSALKSTAFQQAQAMRRAMG